MPPTLIGVDVGGTFTDAVLLSEGRLEVAKRPSTPADPAEAVGACLAVLDPAGRLPLVHGSTVATNALLERRGARTGLVLTRGFRSLLSIGRGARTSLYALQPAEPPSLVPDELVFETDGRISADGAVVRPLRRPYLEALARDVASAGPDAVAVCLLFSYLNPAHERRVARQLTGVLPPNGHVSTSAGVLAEFREFERASTTTVNAYVAPVMTRYLAKLDARLAGRFWRVMASHGGTMVPEEAGRLAAATVLSGPAGGVYGAVAAAKQAGLTDVLTLDMGGTSTDVSLCRGEIPLVGRSAVGGFPVHLPSVDVVTVGAGGGSLVWMDAGGWLRVGPASAGALPGPAAYGRGGTAPTITDAHVVLGRLPADVPLAASLELDAAAARAALDSLAAALGISVEAAALGALSVVEAQMVRALRRVSVERGVSPASLALVAFGGAGPMHACALAEALGCLAVLVPAYPGVLSAVGLALAAPRATAAQSVVGRAATSSELESIFAALGTAARSRLFRREAAAGRLSKPAGETAAELPPSHSPRIRTRRYADLRYAGQSWELTVPADDLSRLPEGFAAAHRERFGFARPKGQVEIITLRVVAEVSQPVNLPLPSIGQAARAGASRLVVGAGDTRTVPLHQRASLLPGDQLAGPALISQADATTYLPPAWRLQVGPSAELILRRG